jgi:aryl-alcohol dehydrogenase
MRIDGSKALHTTAGPISSNFFGQSSFASHALAYQRNLVKVPKDAPLATYAPLGCGVQTGAGSIMRSFACPRGSSLVIIGAGAVGLSAVMAASIQGCEPIVVIEPRSERRALARELGASHVMDPHAEDVVLGVRAIVPIGADFVLDTSGHVPATQAALEYMSARGTLGLVGVPPDEAAPLRLSVPATMTFGFIVKGIIEGDSEPDTFIPELIQLHRAGRLPLERILRTYAFEDINQAVADQHAGRCVKAVLLFER